MADKNSRNASNASGAWYVDSSCIGCSLCSGIAPSIFSMSDDGSTAFVSAQPADSSDLELAAQALSDCPVQAIGNDG